MKGPVRKILLRLTAVGVLLVVVLLINTFRSRPSATAALSAPLAVVDAGAAAARLSEAVRFETVSFQDPNDGEPGPFLAFHAFLERSFPRVHANLARELVGGLSLLYAWPGRDPALAPVLLLAHQDVVPIAPGSEGLWQQPPFSGALEGGFVWGRGTLDDKGSLLAVAAVPRAGAPGRCG